MIVTAVAPEKFMNLFLRKSIEFQAYYAPGAAFSDKFTAFVNDGGSLVMR